MKLFLIVAVITTLTYAGQHNGLFLTPGPAFERLDRGDAVSPSSSKP